MTVAPGTAHLAGWGIRALLAARLPLAPGLQELRGEVGRPLGHPPLGVALGPGDPLGRNKPLKVKPQSLRA